MNSTSKEFFDTAAALLQQATGCQPSVAAMIAESIALGAIHWAADGCDKGFNDAKNCGEEGCSSK